jgi:hypothetical protein
MKQGHGDFAKDGTVTTRIGVLSDEELDQELTKLATS